MIHESIGQFCPDPVRPAQVRQSVQQQGSQALVPYVSAAQYIRQAQINALFRHSMELLELQLKEHQLFTVPKGKILFLAGTSTAGKSSIIRAYLRKNPDTLEAGIDKTGRSLILDLMNKQFPKELAIIQDALAPDAEPISLENVVFSPQFPAPYRTGLSDLDKQRVEEAAQKVATNLTFPDIDIHQALLDEALRNSIQGRPTIFDHVSIQEVAQRITNLCTQFPFQLALAYCPFHTLSERMDQRNQEAIAQGKPEEIRAGLFPLQQFAKLFGPKSQESDVVLGTLSRKTVVHDCHHQFRAFVREFKKKKPEEYYAYLGRLQGKLNLADERALLQKEVANKVDKMLQMLGFTSDKIVSVEISPRFTTYQYLLDTSRLTADQSAQELSESQ